MVTCYCRGTRILTPAGEVPVEDLKIGDTVATLSGAARPIRWIGHRAYDGRFVARNRGILPICVTAGALADNVPARDLWLSPEHSLHIDGVLVRAEHLVNGATIARAESVERVEYFHIELDSHDIVFADGAPAETYVDCDNRMMFSNGAEYARLHPADERPTWEFCLPRLEWDAEALTRVRAALSERAELLGHVLDSDPGLHLVVDGEEIQPDSATARRCLFQVPAGSGAVWLASRSAVPAETMADSRDVRRLGVPIERIVLCDGDLAIEAWHGHRLLCEGFHQDEASHRWTDGMARLPDALLRPFAGPVTLAVHLTPSELGYRPAPPARAAAAAA
jgi:Hint domain